MKLIAGMTMAAAILAPAMAPGQQAAQDRRPLAVTTELFGLRERQACDRGLAWLATQQNSNGSWTCKIGYKLYEDYHGEEGQDVGVSALCGMAFVGAGNVPGRGKYGAVVGRCMDFILASTREEDGYITSNGSRMYSHAFATMFLAEIQGTSPRPDLREKLQAYRAQIADAVQRDQLS